MQPAGLLRKALFPRAPALRPASQAAARGGFFFYYYYFPPLLAWLAGGGDLFPARCLQEARAVGGEEQAMEPFSLAFAPGGQAAG